MAYVRGVLLAGFAAGLLLLMLWVVLTPIARTNPSYAYTNTREVSARVDHGLDVKLDYDNGSRGAPTFLVHVKNVSGHTVGIRQFLRYFSDYHMADSDRNENSFLLCLGEPGNAVPLNRYTTHAINNGFATPLKAEEEGTFEYQMQHGDIERIGARDVTACVCYYDVDPMQPGNGTTPDLLQAWSAPIKIVPLQWGPVDNGLQVGLQIKDGVATIQARNVSDQPVFLDPPMDEDSSSRNAFYFLEVLDYSGMGRSLHSERIGSHRQRHDPLWLGPGQVITATYQLTFDDLRRLRWAQLRARCAQLLDPARHHGRAAFSNAVEAPSPWGRLGQ